MNTFATALRHERLLQHEHRLRPEIERLRRVLAGDPETVRLDAALSGARDRRRELELQLRQVDQETEERRRRAGARERELMSGHVRSPADLMRLRHEVDHLKEVLDGAEDAELALLEEADRQDAEIEAAWDQLPSEWRAAIERIHAHHPDAVAEVVDGLCQGCHVAVTSSGRQELRRGVLVTCDNCGRILVTG
jgi:predicted  nucleic acid-binding Zn-ribbon protein